MKAHSIELKLSAVAQSVTCSIDVAQAQAQPSFSYCHNNKVNAYPSSGSGLPETVRYLVDGNFSTSMNSGYADAYVDFSLEDKYIGKTLTKFAYWWTITSDISTLYSKIWSFSLYYWTGSAWTFYKTVTCSKTALGTTVEEWDIAMPCPTGRVRVIVGNNYDTGFYRKGFEIAFGCWT